MGKTFNDESFLTSMSDNPKWKEDIEDNTDIDVEKIMENEGIDEEDIEEMSEEEIEEKLEG